MLEPVQRHKHVPSYNAIRLTCQRRGITCDMRYRKIYATYLHQEGILVEIIDALQGRTPASLFCKMVLQAFVRL
jgi:intergrase/recombinase